MNSHAITKRIAEALTPVRHGSEIHFLKDDLFHAAIQVWIADRRKMKPQLARIKSVSDKTKFLDTWADKWIKAGEGLSDVAPDFNALGFFAGQVYLSFPTLYVAWAAGTKHTPPSITGRVMRPVQDMPTQQVPPSVTLA